MSYPAYFSKDLFDYFYFLRRVGVVKSIALERIKEQYPFLCDTEITIAINHFNNMEDNAKETMDWNK